MRIVIAPNAFKNALPAPQAAEAIEQGIRASRKGCETILLPAADGGDGTGTLLIQHLNAERRTAKVSDPVGRPTECYYGWLPASRTAIIEMATASGLRFLKPEERNPLIASSAGTGELIRLALDQQPKKIILCIGGTATVDGATGALQALGMEFIDQQGKPVLELPKNFEQVHAVSSASLDPRLQEAEIVVLCDVENYLLGPDGAAAVFGPQKGASPAMVILLEKRLEYWRNLVLQQTGFDMNTVFHGGAAGGTSAAFAALLHAKLVAGADYFLDLVGFDSFISSADLVITGEGSLDSQSLKGKGPFAIAKRAKRKGKKVIGMAGLIPQKDQSALLNVFDELIEINQPGDDPAIFLQKTAEHLKRAAYEWGKNLQE